MDYLTPILENLFGYDLIIIAVAVGALCYYLFLTAQAGKVSRVLYPAGYMPDDAYDDAPRLPPGKDEIKAKKGQLRHMRERSEKYYAMFTNLIAIFPLLGILGTVLALIPLVQGMDDVTQNFFVALTSTLWGLVFAITFKLLDGLLSPKIERNIRAIEEFLQRLDFKLKQIQADEAAAHEA